MTRECPWCSGAAEDEASTCPSCGAAMAQRESIGDLAIPGVTTVDPALQDFDKRPLHLRGPSPSQGVASSAIVAAAAGGPIGLAALGGLAAMAAVEYAGAATGPGGERVDPAMVGRPSEAVLQALEHLEPEPDAPPKSPASEAEEPPPPDPWADLPRTDPPAG